MGFDDWADWVWTDRERERECECISVCTEWKDTDRALGITESRMKLSDDKCLSLCLLSELVHDLGPQQQLLVLVLQ